MSEKGVKQQAGRAKSCYASRVLHRVKLCPGAKPILHYYQIAQTIPALFSDCANYSVSIGILRTLLLYYWQIAQTIHAQLDKPITQTTNHSCTIGSCTNYSCKIDWLCKQFCANHFKTNKTTLCTIARKKIEFQTYVRVFFDLWSVSTYHVNLISSLRVRSLLFSDVEFPRRFATTL